MMACIACTQISQSECADQQDHSSKQDAGSDDSNDDSGDDSSVPLTSSSYTDRAG